MSVPALSFLLCVAGCNSKAGSDSTLFRADRNNASSCTNLCHYVSGPAPDPLATNGAGAAGKHAAHVTQRGISCTVCHFDYQSHATHMNGTTDTADPAVRIVYFDSGNPAGTWSDDAGPQTGSCSLLACHGPNTVNWYGAGGAIVTCTVACHAPDSVVSPDPLRTNGAGSAGKHQAHVRDRGIACTTCHYRYTNQYTHMNDQLDTGNPGVRLVNFDPAGVPSGTWIDDNGPGTGRCSAVSCHGTDILSWYGSGGSTVENCTATCHNANSIASPDPLSTNGSGTFGKHVIHVRTRGFSCSKCHLNYLNNASHMNGILDTGSGTIPLIRFDASNPAGLWSSVTAPRAGTCSSLACHNAAALDWYGTNTWTLPDCAVCHSAAVGSRRAVQGPSGDFNKQSHHVINYAGRTTEIATTADCRVCHSLASHMSGTVTLNDKDQAGRLIVYDPNNTSSLEPFCLSCHDADGATTEPSPLKPFSGGNTLGTVPNAAGTTIEASWNRQYGHRRQGLTCLGSGIAGTGCHGNYNAATQTGSINAHGSGNYGLLTNKFTLPVPNETWDSTRYKLCLDCHAYYPALHTISQLVGVAPGGNYAQPQSFYGQWPYAVEFMATGFHDYLSYTFDRQYNLHLYHMATSAAQWCYRGGASAGAATCVSCHNVHGVNGRYFYLWDEWGFSIETESGPTGTVWGKIQSGNFSGTSYPQYCSFNCHMDGNFRYPRSPFNEAKAVAFNASGGTHFGNGDTVVISFSDSTNGPAITSANISTVLALSNGHAWIGTGGAITAAWSSTNGKTNNVLTVTILSANPTTGDPTIAVGDLIIFDVTTITDAHGTPVRGKMLIMRAN